MGADKQRRLFVKIFFFWLIITAFFIIVSLEVNALSQGFRFDPMLIERTLAPGDNFSYTIYVDNNDDFNPLFLDVSVQDLGEDIRGSYQLLPPDTTSYSPVRWTTVEPDRLTIPPGGTRTVEVNVDIPRGVSGGIYGAVALTVAPERGEESDEAFARSAFTFRSASYFELVITGGALRQEAYADFFDVELSGDIPALRSRVGDNALVFSVGVTNEGNVHIVTEGELIIRTAEGRTVARYPLGGGRGVILPEATVALRSVIPGDLPPGDYNARAIVSYGGRRPVISEVDFSVDERRIEVEETEREEGARFSVMPEELDLNLRPGAFTSQVIEVINSGDEPIELQGEVRPLVFDRQGNIMTPEENISQMDWIDISPDTFQLNPGQTRRLRLTLRPPRDFSGGYYADLFFSTVGEAVHTETGIDLLAFVGEEEIISGTVEFDNIEEIEGSLNIDLSFVNSGNVHLFPSAEIILSIFRPQVEAEDGRIIGARWERITSASLEKQINPVLPGAERAISFFLPAGLETGEYELSVRVDYGGEEPEIKTIRFDIGEEEFNDEK